MGLEKLLKKKKDTIEKKWFEWVIKTYAPETAVFFKNHKESFTNPVGSTTFKGLKGVFNELLTGFDTENIKNLMDPLIRIRAVQNFSPSQAVSFIFPLKNIIREELKKELKDKDILEQYLQFSLKIDDLSLIAFDIYMSCKEKIYNLKAYEARNLIHKAFSRAGLVEEIPQEGPDKEGPDNKCQSTHQAVLQTGKTANFQYQAR